MKLSKRKKTFKKLMYVGQHMPNKWYLEVVFNKNIDGVTRIKKIFESVGLNHLADALNSKNVLPITKYSAGETSIFMLLNNFNCVKTN